MSLCKICKSKSIKIIDTKTDKIYHRCQNCDYIYLNNKFHLNQENEKKHYDNHNNNLESLGYVKIFENLITDFILPQKQNIKTALDFGCGEGEVLPTLLNQKNILCDKYDLFYFPKKNYRDKKYDLITSTEVFEHLNNPLNTIKELLLHLNKNGYLLIMSAFHPSDNEDFLKWFYIKDVTHIGFFSILTFQYLAKKFNLKILQNNSKNIIMFKKL